MRLLFDHNLSHRLVDRLANLYPGSTQTRLLGLERAPDTAIWEHARQNGLAVVTLDKDFADLAFVRGAPPKIIWLRCGNSTVGEIERLLRVNLDAVLDFGSEASAAVLEIWP